MTPTEARHELWLERDARRRAQWRVAQARRRRRQRSASRIVGYLHALGCTNPDHASNRKCAPIAVYEPNGRSNVKPLSALPAAAVVSLAKGRVEP